MKKYSVDICSLVILLSLICFVLEIGVYYFIPWTWSCVVVAAILSLAITHFCLETSLDYDYCFIHANFMVISTLAFSIITYIIQPNQWLHFEYSLVLLVLTNWLVPFIYGFVRDLMDYGPRFDGYRVYFHRMSFLFFALFLLVVIKQYFLTPILPPYRAEPFGAHNFVPFMSTASYIERLLRKGNSLTPILLYILQMICLGIPTGFFCRLYCRRFYRFFRFLTYLAVPVVLEFLQYTTGLGRGDIDDVTTSVIGILLGIALYHIMNGISQSISNRELMMTREQRSRYFS